jgi:hypothetical protein
MRFGHENMLPTQAEALSSELGTNEGEFVQMLDNQYNQLLAECGGDEVEAAKRLSTMITEMLPQNVKRALLEDLSITASGNAQKIHDEQFYLQQDLPPVERPKTSDDKAA